MKLLQCRRVARDRSDGIRKDLTELPRRWEQQLSAIVKFGHGSSQTTVSSKFLDFVEAHDKHLTRCHIQRFCSLSTVK